MGFFDLLRGKKASDQPKTLPMVETVGGSGLFVRDENHGGLDEYRGWTFACVRAIAEKVSSIQLDLVKRKGDDVEPVLEHPIKQLFADVNPFMTFTDLIATTQSYLELEGNAFWWVAKANGVPVAIWPLRPDLVTIVPDETLYIKEYVYKIGNKKFPIPPEDIIHFHEFNPKDPFRGLGTTYAAAASINADNYARDWQRAFFKNGARIDGVITKDGTMTPAEYKEIREKWRDNYQGAEKAHKTAILSGGLKYTPIGSSPADMDFVNLRTMSRDEILAMFRVPKTVLGVTDGTQTRATAETSEYVFMKETIRPKMEKLTRTINEYLLPLFGETSMETFYKFIDPVPENKELALLVYGNALANGWMTRNEVRAKEGLPPVENGDAILVPFGLDPLGEPIKTAKPVHHAVPQSKAGIVEVAKGIASAIAPAIKAVADMEEFERRGEKVQKAQVKRGESYEKKLAKLMDEYLTDLKGRVLDAVDAEYGGKKGKLTKAANSLIDPDAEEEEIIKVVKKFFQVLVAEEGNEALVAAGLEAAFDDRSKRVQDALMKNIKKFAGEITEETSRQVREAIAEGLDEGEDLTDLRKRVDDLTAFGKVRSEIIARTETTRAQNLASVLAWKESGVVEGKVWYTALDERVDDECAALHGEEFGLDENVDPGNNYGRVDGPPIHPNCRCTLLPIVSEKRVRGAEEKDVDIEKDIEDLERIDKMLELDDTV